MKMTDRLLTLLLLIAAPVLRLLERRNCLDAAGLPDGGVPYFALFLPVAAIVFALASRRLPARDTVTAEFGRIFRFDGDLALTAAVGGAFLLLASAVLRLVSVGAAGLDLALSAFLALSGAAMLYVLVSLRRAREVEPLALLVPVCYLVVQLIVTYRANARESVLLHFYVALLTVAALCLAALYLAAFAYRCGAPRAFSALSRFSIVLTATCAVEQAAAQRLDACVGCVGAILLLLAFLEAAGDFEG